MHFENLGWILSGILALVLAGQLFAATSDYYLAVENPRPVGERTDVVTIKGWGLVSQNRDSRYITGSADLGVADMRFFTTGRQIALSLLTLGFLRPVSICYRCHAAGMPLGQA